MGLLEAIILSVLAVFASGCGGKTHTSAIPAGGGAASSTPTTAAPQAPKGPSRVPPAPGEAKLGKKPPIGKPTKATRLPGGTSIVSPWKSGGSSGL